MKWNRFTNKVRKDLYNFQSKEDAGDIWDAIEANVDAINNNNRENDKIRFLFFFIFLLGTSMLTYSVVQKNGSAQFGKPVAQLESNKSSKEIESNIHQVTVHNVNTITNTIPHTNEIIAKPINIDNSRVQTRKINNPTKKIKNTYAQDNTESNNITSALKTKNVRLATSISIYTNHLSQQKYTTEVMLAKNTSTSKHRDLLGVSKIIPPVLKNIPNNFSQKLPSKEFIPAEGISDDELNINKNSRFSFGFDFGYIHTSKQLSANQNDVQNFIALRNETENTLEAIHASLTGEFAINSKLSILSGIDYTRINESFRFLEIDEVSTTEVGEKFVLVGSGVNPTNFELMGDINVSNVSLTDYELYNKYELIDIPLLLSYKWTEEKWSFGVQAGLVANVRLHGTGRILDSIQKIDEIEKIDHLKDKLGLSFSLNAILEYHLKPGFSVVFLPRLRYFPNDFSREDYRLKERYQFIGADVGFRYYLPSK